MNHNSLSIDMPDLRKMPDISSLKLPPIAMGTVIPPRMQYEWTVDRQTVSSNVSTRDFSAVLSVLSDIRSAVRDGKVIAVDGDVFGKLVYNKYNFESGRKGTSFVEVKG